MKRWGNYFLWCIVVGILAGIGIASHSYAAIIGEFFASYCAFSHQKIAVKGVIQ